MESSSQTPDPSAQDADARKAMKDLYDQCQSAWYLLLGFLGFFAVVILSTNDADFLLSTKETQIPLVNVAVPTERFFFLAPIVATLLYCHLHLYCLKLWHAAGAASNEVLADGSSLIADVVRYLRFGARDDRGPRLAGVGTLGAGLLIWAFHPALLVWALFRSQAASRTSWLAPESFPHLARLVPSTVEGMIILCLSISAAIGTASALSAAGIRPGARPAGRLGKLAIVVAFLVPVAFASDWVRGSLRGIRIDRHDFTDPRREWPYAADRREQFRAEWCASRQLDIGVCGTFAGKQNQEKRLSDRRREFCLVRWGTRNREMCRRRLDASEAEFLAQWSARRRAQMRGFSELDLSGRDLSDASAIGTRFVNARMEGTDLSRARLKDADFEGAKLMQATLREADAFYTTFDGANLTEADLSHANLTSSSFEGARLNGADLRGAELADAVLVGADLRGADLRGANLVRARLANANLTDADLDGAVLDGADLSTAIGLLQHQLGSTVGDRSTALPTLDGPAERLNVGSCWVGLPDLVNAVLAERPDDRRREARIARLCPRGSGPARIPAPGTRPAERVVYVTLPAPAGASPDAAVPEPLQAALRQQAPYVVAAPACAPQRPVPRAAAHEVTVSARNRSDR